MFMRLFVEVTEVILLFDGKLKRNMLSFSDFSLADHVARFKAMWLDGSKV